jgi:hypothetical protein
MLGGCGEAVHPDREAALGKALREFAASRSRKAFTHGPIHLVEPLVPPGYLERYRALPTGGEEPRALEGMRAWAALDHAAFLDVIRDPVLAVRERIALSSLPTAAPGTADDPAALLALVAGRLAGEGLPIIVVDFTGPGDPARVVKVIVPGLEVETMTYDRIGRATCAASWPVASTSLAGASRLKAPSVCRCGARTRSAWAAPTGSRPRGRGGRCAASTRSTASRAATPWRSRTRGTAGEPRRDRPRSGRPALAGGEPAGAVFAQLAPGGLLVAAAVGLRQRVAPAAVGALVDEGLGAAIPEGAT